jgi:hypothetical protein
MITFQVISGIILALIIVIILYVRYAPQFGARVSGKSIERIKNPKNFYDGKFQNLVKTTLAGPNTNMLKNGFKFLKSIPGQYPELPVDTIKFDRNVFIEPSSQIKVCWFGHSTLLLNLGGK